MLVVAAAYVAVRGSLPPLDGRRVVAGPAAALLIERDALGVVTITGRSRNDVAFATGFAHAQDRYFQMDLARRMSAGRLAELLGDTVLELDVRNRRHRFGAVAADVVAALEPAERAVLEAYARGVNAGLDSLRVRPFEYLLLRQSPEPWQVTDSLLVVYTMYLQLNDSEASDDRQRGLLAAAVPASVLRYLYSVAPAWEAPIDGVVTAAAPMPTAGQYDLRRYRRQADKRAARASTGTSLDRSAIGSNNWAVAGNLTKSGAALLANDMHLGLAVPNTWYRVRLRVQGGAGDTRDLMGVTLPGVPVMVAGSNGRIAWGYTNSGGDWSDLVRVERSPDRKSYRGAVGWKPIERATETVRSSSGTTRTVTIERTEWGPILPDGPAGAPATSSETLALAWTAQEPAATNLRWLALESMASCEAALTQANRVGGPVQNFVCADAAGNIGWTLLGRLPRRGAGYDAGMSGRLDATRRGLGRLA